MARREGNRARGIVLLALVAAMTLLLAHGLYATLSGARPEPAPARAHETPQRAPAPAPAGAHVEAPAGPAGTAVAAEEEPSGPRVYRGAM